MGQYPIVTPEKLKYSKYWKTNAETFAKQGCYDWMVNQIRGFESKRILDFGCGTGEGVLALLGLEPDVIISIEENFSCLQSTQQLLEQNGYSTEISPRVFYEIGRDGRHDIGIDLDELIREKNGINLVQGDPLFFDNDLPLRKFLFSAALFDVVTIWLIGTIKNRKECRPLDTLNINSPSDYRLLVQNEIYEIADKVLKPGGILQVVDRGILIENEKDKETLLECHEEQASPTSLEVVSIDSLKYYEPETKGIRMSFGEGVDLKGERAMHSVISIKK